MALLEDETQITYFVTQTEEHYDTFDEAKQNVLDNIANLDTIHDKLVYVKKVKIDEGGTIRPLSNRLTHDEMNNIEDATYLCFSVHGNGKSVVRHTQDDIDELILKNKQTVIDGDISYITIETMTMHTGIRPEESNEPAPEEFEEGENGEIYLGKVAKIDVQVGETYIYSNFEYEKVKIE